MKRTQIQLPDTLYAQALAVAEHREISMAELVRRGLEYMVTVSPSPAVKRTEWKLPEPKALHANDIFEKDNWREQLHTGRLYAAEPTPDYPGARKS